MRNTFFVGICLALFCAGCQLFKPLRNPDSLDNATSRTWTVTADFATGLHHVYEQEPDSFSDFGVMTRGRIPVLTRLAAVSRTAPAVTYTLSSRDIEKLRRAVPGGLTLVLYDDGIACLSTEAKKALEQEISKHEYTRQTYFRLLKARSKPALAWTQSVLGHGAEAGQQPSGK